VCALDGPSRRFSARAVIAAVAVSVFVLLPSTVTVIGVRERPRLERGVGGAGAGAAGGWAGLRCALGSRPYMLLNVSYLCTWLCFQVRRARQSHSLVDRFFSMGVYIWIPIKQSGPQANDLGACIIAHPKIQDHCIRPS
jgi:hypothetical protein